MIDLSDSRPDGSEAKVFGGKSCWMQCGVLGAVCLLVIGYYGFAAQSGGLEWLSLNPADTYYNLLVQGFRAGQLSLKKEVPLGFTQLADPYNPTANAPYRSEAYRMHDMSCYRGRLYLYFGVTPALLLFWPYAALTGHYLFHRQAVAIFCAVGFLASVGLLCALWRRYFAGVSVGVVAACALALGLATGVPVLLSRADVYEVPISCGYMLTMLALAAIWRAFHEPEGRAGGLPRKLSGLAAASVACGLAVGARPNLLFGAVILLVPVAHAWRERRPMVALLMAATGPILLIGLGLMLYNVLRFDSPFEFGMHYQLASGRQDSLQFLSLRYLWFNFRVFFLEPARWGSRFPFVHEIAVPPLPPGRGPVESPFGVLTSIPLVWLALAVPLAWRGRSGSERSLLRGFLAAVAAVFGICALAICFLRWTNFRYEVEFLPALLLLAVVGILGLERVLAPTSESGLADRPVWRRAVRWGWGLLLGFSVAFNLLAGVENYAAADCRVGNALLHAGKLQDALGHYERALRIKADSAEAHYDLGGALLRLGRLQEAIGHCEQALRIKPDCAEAHNVLGGALDQAGKLDEAIGHYEQALRIKPDFEEAQNNLGVALEHAGRLQEAIVRYEWVLRLKPDQAETHNNMGSALVRLGRVQEAIAQYEWALRLKPDQAKTHYNLGIVMGQVGKFDEAIAHYEEALRLKPDFAEAHNGLGLASVRLGRIQEAAGHWEQALRLKPDYVEAHYNLGAALEQAGRVQEAIEHYEQALRLKPDLAEAQNALARLRAVQ